MSKRQWRLERNKALKGEDSADYANRGFGARHLSRDEWKETKRQKKKAAKLRASQVIPSKPAKGSKMARDKREHIEALRRENQALVKKIVMLNQQLSA